MTRSNSRARGTYTLMALILVTGIALTVLTQFVVTRIPQQTAGFHEAERVKDLCLSQASADLMVDPPDAKSGEALTEGEPYRWHKLEDRSEELHARMLSLKFTKHRSWPRVTTLRVEGPYFDIYVQDYL